MELVSPGLPYLPSYSDALRRGWAHDNLRLAAAAQEELERIRAVLSEPSGHAPRNRESIPHQLPLCSVNDGKRDHYPTG